MKRKTLLAMILSLVMCLGLVMPAWAAENIVSPADSVDDLVQVTGQIVFDDINESTISSINCENSSVLVSPQTLEFYNNSDESTQQIIRDYIKDGRTIKAIGWTKVFVQENSEGNLVPMTMADLINNINGDFLIEPTKTGRPNDDKPNVVLYTIVGYDNYEPSLLFANSVVEWSVAQTAGSSSAPEPNYDDFLSIEWPDGYFVNNADIIGSVKNEYMQDISDATVIYGFIEQKGKAQINSLGYNKASTDNNRWSSHYVHTWGEVGINIEAGIPSGISISASSTKGNWQIASYVDL